MSKMHDIAVLGATPAGLAAAFRAAARGKDVLVVDPPDHAVECPLLTWVPREFFKIAHLPGGLIKASGAQEFRKVCYHNVSLSTQVAHSYRSIAGYVLQQSDLVDALKSSLTDKGGKVRKTRTAPAIQLREDSVTLLGTTPVHARLLLIAHDQPVNVMGELSLPVRAIPRTALIAAGLDAPLAGAPPKDLVKSLHIVEMPERSELGMFFANDTVCHLRVISSSPASGNRAAELSTMVAGLQREGIIPDNLQLGRAKGAVWHPPAGVALDLETHVAKRCILTGTAGGFVETITGHALLPTVRAAMLAADVALESLDHDDPQGKLMTFKNLWRDELADYLRPPNTSLHMLLPLLFANDRILPKFTDALLYGENI
jgi:hypothetical protein